MTLNQFKSKVKTSLDARIEVARLRDQLEGALRERNDANALSLEACRNVINAIRGDIEEGEIARCGPRSVMFQRAERRSGLRRNITAVKKAA